MPINVIHKDAWLEPTEPHRRILWAPESDDLHVNLVDLRAGDEIGEHVNASLDVVLTCLDGDGMLQIDGEAIPVAAGSIVLLPMGARRAITAGEGGMRYTTCHRKRSGLMPTVPSRT